MLSSAVVLRQELLDLQAYLARPVPHPGPLEQAAALVRAGRMVADVLILGLSVTDELQAQVEQLQQVARVLTALVLLQVVLVVVLLSAVQ